MNLPNKTHSKITRFFVIGLLAIFSLGTSELLYVSSHRVNEMDKKEHRAINAIKPAAWKGPFLPMDEPIEPFVKFSLSADGYYWLVKKPGDYLTDGLYLNIICNSNVRVIFSDFEDLKNISPFFNSIVNVRYYFSDNLSQPPLPNDPGWLTASELNNFSFSIRPSPFEPGWRKYIWAWISVSSLNSSDNYKDPNGAIITITLQQTEDWIDPLVSYNLIKGNDRNLW
jgi:hypothetical protein